MTEKIQIAGLSVEILRKGAGQTLLFLHPGDGIDASVPAVDRLAKRFDVIAPSHPGFDESDLPANFSTVDDLAYFYLDLLDELDLKDVVLAGVSFGAWLAMEIAIKSTARLSRLVLADAVGVKFGSRDTRDIADLFALTPAEIPPLLYHDAAHFAPDYTKMTVPALTRIARNRESFTLYGWSPTLYDPKLRQRLHRIDLPTLVLWGANDRVVNLDYGRALAGSLPSATLDVIPSCGHFSHVEQPDAFTERVERFAAAGAAAKDRKGVGA